MICSLHCKHLMNWMMMSWMAWYDPVFGPGSYGQISHLYVERSFVMHHELSQLENGGWKEQSKFKPYFDAIAGVASKGSI